MTIAQTSIDAYNSIQDLKGRRLEVYQKLEEIQPASGQQVADALGWPINRVTGRMSELKKLSLIELVRVQKSKFGATETVWQIIEKKVDIKPDLAVDGENEVGENATLFDMPPAPQPKKKWRKEKVFNE